MLLCIDWDVLSGTIVQHITKEDLIRPNIQDQLKIFDENATKRLDDENSRLNVGEDVYKMMNEDFD